MRFMTTRPLKGTDPLAPVRLTENERRAAEHYMELGERIADFILGAAAIVSSLVHGVGRGVRTLVGSGSGS